MNLAALAKVMFDSPSVDWFEIYERHSMEPYCAKRGIAGASNEKGVKFAHDFRIIMRCGDKPAIDIQGDKPLAMIKQACETLGIQMPKLLRDKMEEPKLI